MRVYLGIHRRSTDVTKETTFYAEKVISVSRPQSAIAIIGLFGNDFSFFSRSQYPNFDTGTFQNDLSIIKLNQDVPESETVNFLCLTNNTSIQPGSSVYAVGWGYTLENFSSGKLQTRQYLFS